MKLLDSQSNNIMYECLYILKYLVWGCKDDLLLTLIYTFDLISNINKVVKTSEKAVITPAHNVMIYLEIVDIIFEKMNELIVSGAINTMQNT